VKRCEKVKILGIDPGTINCGYAVLDLSENVNKPKLIEAGLIKMKSRILQEQIMELVEGIDIILKNNKIDEVAIEDMFFAYYINNQ
jgi:crossover junction endodeoxyribonuclease RuvC